MQYHETRNLQRLHGVHFLLPIFAGHAAYPLEKFASTVKLAQKKLNFHLQVVINQRQLWGQGMKACILFFLGPHLMPARAGRSNIIRSNFIARFPPSPSFFFFFSFSFFCFYFFQKSSILSYHRSPNHLVLGSCVPKQLGYGFCLVE